MRKPPLSASISFTPAPPRSRADLAVSSPAGFHSKINYCRHFQIDEPETYAVLSFGAISGGVGATSVYRSSPPLSSSSSIVPLAFPHTPHFPLPLPASPDLFRSPIAINVLRTKLQASGSTGHPQTYTGFYDVLQKTISKEGWRGMYKGLTVTLAKVVPAVSISYVVRPAFQKWCMWSASVTVADLTFL